MESTSNEAVVRRQKRPLLSLLHRRSTKIEPENSSAEESLLLNNSEDQPLINLDVQQNPPNANEQPSSGLTRNSSKKILERNNTFPSLNAPTKCTNNNSISVNQNDNNNSELKDTPKNLCCDPSANRYSFCCAMDDQNLLSPTLNLQSETEESRPSSVSRRPLEIDEGESPKSIMHNLPSYESYPSPILLSSCRSRFRDKFLQPPEKSESQHYSSPNISSQEESPQRRDSRKSGSYDAIIPSSNGSVKFPSEDLAPVSADSLARQALMAAHVLHLIPTEKARQRNFLQGRLAPNALLGNAELEKVLPTRDVSIFIGTWNMNGQPPPKQLNDFVLPSGIEHVPDIFVIGTQEACSERFEWEVTLQETLGPSHVLFHSTALGTLHLAVFLRRDLIWFCSEPEDASLSVRTGTAFRTKGAVAISFCLFGTSMLFVTSHLTAHQQKVKERVSDVKKIIQSLDLPRNLPLRYRNKDVTQNFDSVYWCGDLNFRLSEPRANLMKWLETTSFPLPPHLPHGFLHTDQLTSVLADGAAFKGFKEAKIHFPPTYKYDVGTQQFDTSSKQRAPAYTDRILYKYKLPPLGFRRTSAFSSGDYASGGSSGTPPTPIKAIAYDSVQSITSSDHKPVWALFKNVLRPGIDSIPLAAGLFNRDVYLEGMKRRLDNTNAEASTVCSIQ